MGMSGFIGEHTRAPRNWRREKRRASKVFACCIHVWKADIVGKIRPLRDAESPSPASLWHTSVHGL
jgi:hypothetical protein